MDKKSNTNFDTYDEFVIKYFSFISILTAGCFALMYIILMKNFNLFLLNISLIFVYIILWYTGIKFKKWYFAYIITYINMFHVFIYTYILFPFNINFHFYFLMYPMAMLTIREAKIDAVKIATFFISLFLFAYREILGDKLNVLFQVSYFTRRIFNLFTITSLMLGLFFVMYSHIIRLNKFKKELYHQSITDQLTGLYNRRYIFDQYSKLDHNSDDTVCIMIIDIDDFKVINDKYGHSVGDLVIKSVSEIMENTVNYAGVVGRIGGEEFCVVLTNKSKEVYTNLSEKTRSNIENMKIQVENNIIISCTVSIGVACQREYNYTFNKLFISADKAMYSAKSLGKNRVELFSN